MAQQNSNEPIALEPVAYAAQRLNVTLTECWRMIRSGELQSTQLDGVIYVHQSSLIEWIWRLYDQERRAIRAEYEPTSDEIKAEFRRRFYSVRGKTVSAAEIELSERYTKKRERLAQGGYSQEEKALAELARRFGVVEDPFEDPDGRRLNPFDAY